MVPVNRYDYEYIEQLFDTMSGSYERVNYITSFGFSARWRSQFVADAHIQQGAVVVDLMTGMGECWGPILKAAGKDGKLVAIDFSDGMLGFARKRKKKRQLANVEVQKQNVFENDLADGSCDAVVSGFGIKTLNNEQLTDFAAEVHRLLKPGGTFSLVEVSVPPAAILRWPYMFYVKFIIPLLGRIMLGNPENYRMLGIYTQAFGNAKEARSIFQDAGFEVQYHNYFFGCASGISGRKV